MFTAGQVDAPGSSKALESLCRLYWYPIYVFLRRWGHPRQDASDLTQGFFAYVIELNLLRKADPDKGRFRSFLLGTLKRYVSNQQAKERALKRGGGIQFVSIDEATAEGRYAHEPTTDLSPERLFDRRWALTVLAESMQRLEQEYRRADMRDLFALLQPYLTGEPAASFAQLAGRLNKTEVAARVLVFRLRNRFQKLIRDVIADTVASPDQVECELEHLQGVLRGD